jgi:iron complex transport system substrate-binding protein
LRIVSLCPSNTEILFALGAGPEVKAVEKWTDYPPEAVGLPTVGTEMDVDMALVASHKPDLVLASLSVPGMEKNVEALEKAGLPYLVLNPKCLDDVYTDLDTVGKAISREREAARLTRKMKSEIESIRQMNRGRSRPARVYIEWWADPCITPGRLCWTRAMIEAAGGENIFADQEVRSRPVHAEEVVKGDPELILLCWAGIPFDEIDPAKARARKEWNRITAVQTGSLHPVEEGWYGRPGPRVVLGIRQMAEWIAALEDKP